MLQLVLFFSAISLWNFADLKVDTSKTRTYHVHRLHCDYSPDLCETIICSLRQPKRGKQAFDIGCNLRNPLTDVRFHPQLLYRYQTGFKPYLIDFDEDFCLTMANIIDNRPSSTPILSYMMPPIMAVSNINHKCPFSGNVTVSNLSFGDVMFNYVIPNGEYMIKIRIYLGKTNTTIITPVIRFSFAENGVAGFQMG